jgi:hypothetical protein
VIQVKYLYATLKDVINVLLQGGKMKGISNFASAIVLSLSIIGCSGGSNSVPETTPPPPAQPSPPSQPPPSQPPPPPPPIVVNGTVQVVNVAIDSPDINIVISDENLITDLEYADASTVLSVPPKTYKASVNAVLPGNNNTLPILGPVDLTVAEAKRYTVFTVGKVADDSFSALVVPGQLGGIPLNKIRLQLVHAAANAPEVSVHVTAPGAELATPNATFSFKGYSPPIILDPANYQVRITLTDNQTVLFDSASLDYTEVGTDLVLAAIDSQFSGSSPVSLLAVAQDGSQKNIIDAKANASLRVVHNASDAEPFEIRTNSDTSQENVISFTDFTDYFQVVPKTYEVSIILDVSSTNSITVVGGEYYSLLASGSVNESDDASIEALIYTDLARRIATEAQLRIIHGSTLTGNVDIYITANGDISQVAANYSNVTYKTDVGYMSLLAGDYVITVTKAAEKTVVIETAVSLTTNRIYTAITRDGENLDNTMLGLIKIDDFVVE